MPADSWTPVPAGTRSCGFHDWPLHASDSAPAAGRDVTVKRIEVILATALTLGACTGTDGGRPAITSVATTAESQPGPPVAPGRPPCSGRAILSLESSQRRLRTALETLLEHAYHAERIDQRHWEDRIAHLPDEDLCTSKLTEVIRAMVRELGDGHSRFLSADPGGRRSGAGPLPRGQVDGALGVLVLPATAAEPDSDAGRRYVRHAWSILQSRPACAWIVDLTENSGGNLPTMLQAVAPLLGVGPTIGYRNRNGSMTLFSIAPDGTATLGPETLDEEGRPLRSTSGALHPVAVVQGPLTASSGEGVAMAFRGRPTSRSFGSETAGLTTGIEGYSVPDGQLLLATSVGVDFGGTAHEGPLTPERPTSNQSARQDARAWLAGLRCPHLRTPGLRPPP